ncbi:6-phosphofructokinase [Dehalobacter sp. DCM]|uniref:6-phosphofructokinase n=1 Tax=Dehalobacter sp. DCM TaxID=2907827 RepID=UPI003081E917|nr:6-phosphofructokinase [Dehalobacter sp. DCM]
MMKNARKIAVLTSGGDAPGMNAAIRAVVRKGIYHDFHVFGVYHGYDGLLNGEIKEMALGSVADIIHRGGTVIRTARCEEMYSAEGQEKAARQLKNHGIEYLIVIGGDGSYRGAAAIAKHGIKVIGIPGTIDNDITGTDLTIGFDTAVNTVVEAVSKLRDTASSHERAFIVEVMGRNCGDIALKAGLAIGAESILVPEIAFDLAEISEKLVRGYRRGKNHSIIICAEGAGNVWEIAEKLKQHSGFETRVTILGHVQRGGAPSAADAVLGAVMGGKAVDAVLEGKSDIMISHYLNQIVDRPLDLAFGPRTPFDSRLYELANQLAI